MKLKKTYSFSLLSSVYLTVTLLVLNVLISFLLPEDKKLLSILVFFPTIFIISFLIIQYRTERFIYDRMKKIYDEVSVLNEDEFTRASATTDIDSLSNSVKNYVQGKRIEIKNLTERDSFRKDFLGNVSHELKTPLFMVQGYILTLTEGAINDKLIRDKYLGRANKGVDRLVAIVKDLDMIAKLETEGLKLNYEFLILLILFRMFLIYLK